MAMFQMTYSSPMKENMGMYNFFETSYYEWFRRGWWRYCQCAHFFCWLLYCCYLNRLIPPLNIPSKLGIDHANDDEIISDMEGTT